MYKAAFFDQKKYLSLQCLYIQYCLKFTIFDTALVKKKLLTYNLPQYYSC